MSHGNDLSLVEIHDASDMDALSSQFPPIPTSRVIRLAPVREQKNDRFFMTSETVRPTVSVHNPGQSR